MKNSGRPGSLSLCLWGRSKAKVNSIVLMPRRAGQVVLLKLEV